MKIYEAISIAAAERYRLPSPWDRFGSSDAFHQLPADLEPLLNQLVKQFDRPALIAAGVLVKDGTNAPIANPWLEKFQMSPGYDPACIFRRNNRPDRMPSTGARRSIRC